VEGAAVHGEFDVASVAGELGPGAVEAGGAVAADPGDGVQVEDVYEDLLARAGRRTRGEVITALQAFARVVTGYDLSAQPAAG